MRRPVRLALFAIVASAIVATPMAVSYAWPRIAPVPMLIFGHSGDLASGPDNTLESVVAASKTAADGIEIDVRLSADGTFWLAHKADVGYMTNGRGPISQLRDHELAELIVTHGPGYQAGQESLRLTTLDATIEALQGYHGGLMIDVKAYDAASYGRIGAIFAGRPATWIMCASAEGARIIKSIDPNLRTVTLANETYDPNIDMWLGQAELPFWWPGSAWADLFGDVGMYIDGEHVGDESDLLRRARESGVSLLITNDIEAAIRWREAH